MSRASPHHFQLERSKTVHEKGMAVADPDLKLRVGGRGRFGLLTLPAFLPPAISYFNQNKRGTEPPSPSPRSATGDYQFAGTNYTFV